MALAGSLTSHVTPAEAAKELLFRRKARKLVGEFINYMEFPAWSAAHHRLMVEAMQEIVDGANDRLMVFLPPGSAKSTFFSVYLPAFHLGARPGEPVIGVSYNVDLAKVFARRVRNVVSDPRWANLFAGGLEPGFGEVVDWGTTLGSSYRAAGMMTGVTGRRAGLIVIDDPLKGRTEADSPTIRQKVWDTYIGDIRTRRLPGCAIVWVLTRWHEDDPIGRILPEDFDFKSGMVTARDGETWRVISIPAEAEDGDVLGRAPGEWLWPEWWPEGFLAQEKVTQGPRNWASLYQQRPAPEEGNFFLRDWLRYYEERPQHIRIYGASDYAVTADGGDYTVHAVIGVDPDDNIYLLDLWRKQTTTDAWVEALLDMAKQYKPLAWFEEGGQIIKAVGPLIDRRQRERSVYFYRKQFTSAADKATRAQSIRGRAAQGKVYLPKNAPWLSDFVFELLTFPAGRNDDQVDVLSLFGRALAAMVGGEIPKGDDVTNIAKRPTFDQMVNSMRRPSASGGRI